MPVSRADYTSVEIRWRKKRINHRLLFGEPDRLVRLDWQRRLAIFCPGKLVGYERWTGTKFGTKTCRIFIFRTAEAGHALSNIPGVKPGGTCLLKTSSNHQSKSVSSLMSNQDILGSLGQLSDNAWRVIHNQIQAGYQPADISKNTAP